MTLARFDTTHKDAHQGFKVLTQIGRSGQTIAIAYAWIDDLASHGCDSQRERGIGGTIIVDGTVWDGTQCQGCGQTLMPFSAQRRIDLDISDEDLEAVRDELVAVVAAAAADATVSATAKIQARLDSDIADALRQLADGASIDDIITGAEDRPGIFVDLHGDLFAWDFDPVDSSVCITASANGSWVTP